MEKPTDDKKRLLAEKSGELESLKLRRESLQKQLDEASPRWAQIMVIAGLGISVTVVGLIFGIGPLLFIIGVVYWYKINKKRKLLEEEISETERKIGETKTALINLQ